MTIDLLADKMNVLLTDTEAKVNEPGVAVFLLVDGFYWTRNKRAVEYLHDMVWASVMERPGTTVESRPALAWFTADRLGQAMGALILFGLRAAICEGK